MTVVDPPAGIKLNAFREIGLAGKRAYAVEQKIADHIRAERQNAVADKSRDLHIDIIDMFLQLIAQSGLRASTPTVPNGASLPEYAAFNASVVQKLDLGIGQGTELRLDVLNIGDATYEIRNGTGVGIGAPQFGIRRAILAGLTQRF
jgi:hypothetical protein